MKAETFKPYPMLMIVSMVIFTLFKICFMYANTLVPHNLLFSFARTAAALIALYLLLTCILASRSFILQLLFHELLALIVLADILYFRYFNSLPLATDLQLLPVIPAIWDSIMELFRPTYLLLFADAVLLIICRLIWGKNIRFPKKSLRPLLIAATAFLLIIVLDFTCFGSKNCYQNFNSFGLLHFHGSQIAEMMKSREAYTNQTLLVKDIEDVSKSYSSPPKYFGIARDRNVIIIQVEALQGFAINRYYNGQEITPNLNRLIKEDTLYFDSYYHHIAKGGTSDAEFTTLNSMYPSSDVPSYTKYAEKKLMGLPKILQNRGYSTLAFHGFQPEFWNRASMYPTLGFDKYVNSSELKKDEVIGWGVSDKSFFKQVAGYLSRTKEPALAFAVTLSNHYPYNLPDRYKLLKLPNKQSTFIERYMQSINYTDASIGVFINELKKKGLYDNAIIAIYGDHHAISNRNPRLMEQMSKLLGYRYDEEEMANIPLIVHIPHSNVTETVSTVGGQLDFMPTMLNLLGIMEGNIKFYGQDLCNAKDGFATTQLILPKGSFISDDKVFLMSSDGIFEHGTAWNRQTKAPIDIELCRKGYEKVMKESTECSYLLTNDLLLDHTINTLQQQAKPKSILCIAKQRLMQIIHIALR